MSRTILLIHGRGYHPPEPVTRQLWVEALRHAIQRDHPEKLDQFDTTRKHMAYFGDVSNAFLSRAGYSSSHHDEHAWQTLDDLKKYRRSEFTRRSYRRLPGRNRWKRELADTFAVPLYHCGFGETAISSLLPDMAHYWNADSAFGSDVRFSAIRPLKNAMLAGDRLLVIAHSLGSLIAYDTLWKFTHLGEYRPHCCRKTVDRWITLGSPLADPTVRANLKGARVQGPRRYPHNVAQWINVSARDDYISYRPKMRGDFGEMVKMNLCHGITDMEVNNLAVMKGKSDPHNALGYLIHPVTADAVAGWL